MQYPSSDQLHIAGFDVLANIGRKRVELYSRLKWAYAHYPVIKTELHKMDPYSVSIHDYPRLPPLSVVVHLGQLQQERRFDTYNIFLDGKEGLHILAGQLPDCLDHFIIETWTTETSTDDWVQALIENVSHQPSDLEEEGYVASTN